MKITALSIPTVSTRILLLSVILGSLILTDMGLADFLPVDLSGRRQFRGPC